MKRLSLLLFFVVACLSCKDTKQKTDVLYNTKVQGEVFGTTYSVLYNVEGNENYKPQFDSIFGVINNSMSTYIPHSIISRFNRNETVKLDAHFIKVFDASKTINKETQGIFDPTIGIMVNAWDFGPEGKIENLDSLKIKTLMQSVGLDKVTRFEDRLTKTNIHTYLDFNAIAKGYAVDMVGEFLEDQGVDNYLVEIGGEIRAKGISVEKKQPWKVGVENPNFDGTQTILKAIEFTDAAMATSGTYRKYKIDDDGNRYAHIINPKTGYPSKTNLLSISVIAKDCMTADAYATAFKAMGIDKVKAFLKNHPELKVFLIFENDNNELETMSLNGFPDN